jgi:exodeoxyribonuclease V alpha subunit
LPPCWRLRARDSSGSPPRWRPRRASGVRFGDRSVGYDARDLGGLVLAYATSIHKAQGSEYPAVVIPLHSQHYLLLQRRLLYTAVTRGKRLVVLVGSARAMGIALHDRNAKPRNTRLAERLAAVTRGAPHPL